MLSRNCIASFALAASLCATGCVTTQTSKTIADTPQTAKSNAGKPDDTPITKAPDGPKRMPLPQTEITIGKVKEDEAESESAKKNPESQAKLREEARRAYQQALKIDPANVDAMLHLGRLYSKMGDGDRAQEILRKALVAHPKNAKLWFELGACHQRRRDFPESVRCFSKALEFDAENRDYMKRLGITLAWTGNVNDGLTMLTRGYGSASLANYCIACVFDQREQPDQARQYLQAALRENPNLEKAQVLLTHLEQRDTPAVQRVGLNRPVFNP